VSDSFDATVAHYRAQGFGLERIGFGERPAVLVVDMQNDFVDPDAPSTCSPSAEEAVPYLQRLVAAARRHGVPVFYTQGLVSPDLKDVGLWKSRAHAEGRVQVEGTRGAAIIDRLAPRPGEYVVRKRRPSAFFQTDLEVFLRGWRVDTLIVGGTSASGCVRATVVDAFMRDYRAILPRECVIDRTPAVLENNLFDMDAKYADVVSLDEVLAYLDQLPTQTAAPAAARR
jgi:nicotinamidase-related amidase